MLSVGSLARYLARRCPAPAVAVGAVVGPGGGGQRRQFSSVIRRGRPLAAAQFTTAPDATMPYNPYLQSTLSRPVSFGGTSLHTGKKCSVMISPADRDHGIVFQTWDGSGVPSSIRAHYGSVDLSVPLCTALRAPRADGVSVIIKTIEHLCAALHGYGIDNAKVAIRCEEGCSTGVAEMPILDGCSQELLHLLKAAGRDQPHVTAGSASRKFIRVLRPVSVHQGGVGRSAELQPFTKHEVEWTRSVGLELDVSITFDHPQIEEQRIVYHLDRGVRDPEAHLFASEVAPARTFAMEKDVLEMRRRHLALGGSLDNAVVYGADGTVLNPGGLRFADEAVRHKLLDCIGDLSLGGNIVGRFIGRHVGHATNNQLLERLFSSHDNYEVVHVVPVDGVLTMVPFHDRHYRSLII